MTTSKTQCGSGSHATGARAGYSGQRVLVVGGRGFIGRHLTTSLVEASAEVATIARGAASESLPGTHLICDITDPPAVIAAIKGFAPAIVFHLAAHPDGMEDFAHAHVSLLTNGHGTLHVLEACREAGTRVVVYGDSTKVYGAGEVPYRENTLAQPLSSYAIGKLCGWEFCRVYARLYGLSVVAIRPTLVYGPGQAFNLFSYVFRTVEAGQTEIELMGGSQTREPLYIDDAVDAYLAAGLRAAALTGRAVNISGGEERTVVALAELMVELMGSSATVRSVEATKRPTDTERSCCDITEAAHLLGWAPRVPLGEGLRRTIDGLRSDNDHAGRGAVRGPVAQRASAEQSGVSAA